MVTASERLAETQMPDILEQTGDKAKEMLVAEIERLKALSLVNPNIRAEEIDFFERQLQNVTKAVDAAHFRLDALRVLVAT